MPAGSRFRPRGEVDELGGVGVTEAAEAGNPALIVGGVAGVIIDDKGPLSIARMTRVARGR
jgi:hypothetical protein